MDRLSVYPVMLTLVPEEIERYAARHSPEESSLLSELVKVTYAQTDAPQMQVGRLEGGLLRLLVRMVQAKAVLEIGTFTGYSALVMAEGLPDDGVLTTLDEDPETTRIAKQYWARSPHGKKIHLMLGDARETLKTLQGPFDLVFIDADKTNYLHYWEVCVPLVRGGGLLVADNVLWSGRVLKPKDEHDRALVEFNKRVHADPRVEAVMLTVRDGVTVAIKR